MIKTQITENGFELTVNNTRIIATKHNDRIVVQITSPQEQTEHIGIDADVAHELAITLLKFNNKPEAGYEKRFLTVTYPENKSTSLIRVLKTINANSHFNFQELL